MSAVEKERGVDVHSKERAVAAVVLFHCKTSEYFLCRTVVDSVWQFELRTHQLSPRLFTQDCSLNTENIISIFNILKDFLGLKMDKEIYFF